MGSLLLASQPTPPRSSTSPPAASTRGAKRDGSPPMSRRSLRTAPDANRARRSRIRSRRRREERSRVPTSARRSSMRCVRKHCAMDVQAEGSQLNTLLHCRVVGTGHCFLARADPYSDRSRPAPEPPSERAGMYTRPFPKERSAGPSIA
jgi:hypothetical protein